MNELSDGKHNNCKIVTSDKTSDPEWTSDVDVVTAPPTAVWSSWLDVRQQSSQ